MFWIAASKNICNELFLDSILATEPFKKYATCKIAFSNLSTCAALSQFYSITSLVLFTKTNKQWNEKKSRIMRIKKKRLSHGYRKKFIESLCERHHILVVFVDIFCCFFACFLPHINYDFT